jgi:hypothetical protein
MLLEINSSGSSIENRDYGHRRSVTLTMLYHLSAKIDRATPDTSTKTNTARDKTNIKKNIKILATGLKPRLYAHSFFEG